MYSYENMRIYSLNDALFLRSILNSMPEYFWCYPDNTEERVNSFPSAGDIVKRYNEGVFLGKEERPNDPDEDDISMEELSVIINMSNPVVLKLSG